MNFSLEKMIKLLRKHFLVILAVAVLFAAGMYRHKKNNTVPVYTAYTELFANTIQYEEDKIYSGINSERNYVSTYIEMFKTVKYSQKVYSFLSDEDKAKTSPLSIYYSMSVGSKNETAIIYVRIYNTDSALAHSIAKAVATSAAQYLNEEFGVAAVNVVEDARISGVSTVSYKKSVIVGFLLGAMLSFFVFFVKDLYDYRLRSASEIKDKYKLAILGTVPTFDSKANVGSKYNHGYKYSRYSDKKKKDR